MLRKPLLLLVLLQTISTLSASSEIILKTRYIWSDSANDLSVYFEFFDFDGKKPLNIDVVRVYQGIYHPDNLIHLFVKNNNNADTSRFNVRDLNRLFIDVENVRNENHGLDPDVKYVFVFLADYDNRPTGQVDWVHLPFYSTEEARWLFDDKGWYRRLFGVIYRKGFLWGKDKLIVHITNEQAIVQSNSVILTDFDGTKLTTELSAVNNDLHFALEEKLEKGDLIYVVFPVGSFTSDIQSDDVRYLFEVP